MKVYAADDDMEFVTHRLGPDHVTSDPTRADWLILYDANDASWAVVPSGTEGYGDPTGGHDRNTAVDIILERAQSA